VRCSVTSPSSKRPLVAASFAPLTVSAAGVEIASAPVRSNRVSADWGEGEGGKGEGEVRKGRKAKEVATMIARVARVRITRRWGA